MTNFFYVILLLLAFSCSTKLKEPPRQKERIFAGSTFAARTFDDWEKSQSEVKRDNAGLDASSRELELAKLEQAHEFILLVENKKP